MAKANAPRCSWGRFLADWRDPKRRLEFHVKPFVWILPLAALFLAGCSTSPAIGMLRKYGNGASLASFTVCSNYGCSREHKVALTPEEWATVTAAFMPQARDAVEEREQIRRAIARIETIVGPKTGTEKDAPGAAIINFLRNGQMDCIDEAYNTSLYLTFLANERLFAWHDVGTPAKRGLVIDRWFHNTATIVEHGTGAPYTVDSWFGPNGAMPDVVPLQAWLDGWSPPEAT
jgi:hypothetical protein